MQDEGFVGAEVVKVKLLQALAAPAGPPAKRNAMESDSQNLNLEIN